MTSIDASRSARHTLIHGASLRNDTIQYGTPRHDVSALSSAGEVRGLSLVRGQMWNALYQHQVSVRFSEYVILLLFYRQVVPI
jgi:hypothetical protein